MRHPEPKASTERFIPLSLRTIVGGDRSRSIVSAPIARARRESASSKHQRCSRSSPPSLFNSALEPTAASVAFSGLGSRGRHGGRGSTTSRWAAQKDTHVGQED